LKKTISFLKYRFIAFGVSIALIVIFVIGTVVNDGLNMGIDFVGGIKIISKFSKETNETTIRKALPDINVMIQKIGADEKNEFIISTKLGDTQKETKNQSDIIKNLLTKEFPEIKFLSVENVGPAIGDFLKKSAYKLFIVAILIY